MLLYFSRIRRNLSIHIARVSASESLRAYPNIYKNSPPFASSKGVPNRESPASVKAHVPVSHMVILSLLALRSDVSIIARALFNLFLPFIHLSSLILHSLLLLQFFNYFVIIVCVFSAVVSWMLTDNYAALDLPVLLLPSHPTPIMAAKGQPRKSTKMIWHTCLNCTTRLSELCYDTHTLC